VADRILDRDLLTLQDGTLTRAQALYMGLTDKAISARLQSGRWQRLYPGVYAAFSGDPGRSAWLWAAVHSAGPAAVLSHQTAAEIYGLAGVSGPSQLVHLTVPSGIHVVRRAGVALHHSRRVAQARHPVLLPPRTRIEETVLDLTQTAGSLDGALDWVFRASGSRLTTADRIGAAMSLRRRMRWRDELTRALDLEQSGIHSLLEWRYADGVERPHGLPRGRRQHRARRGGRSQYQDVSYDGFDTIVELDGRAAHPSYGRWRDIRRDNANIVEGQVTLRYGWADVTERKCEVAVQVGAAIRQRGWSDPLRRCGSRCRIQ
jgi:hypothetical protein